jgi:hypothetical protein
MLRSWKWRQRDWRKICVGEVWDRRHRGASADILNIQEVGERHGKSGKDIIWEQIQVQRKPPGALLNKPTCLSVYGGD